MSLPMFVRSAPLLTAAWLWLLPVAAPYASAQQPASIIGRVLGPDSAALLGVRVELLGIGEQRTDSAGAVRFTGLPTGTFMLRATRIGYRPVIKMVTTLTGESITVTVNLDRSVEQLPTVLVRSDSSSTPLTDPSGFDHRRRNANGGYYILAEDIERKHLIETEQLFHGIPAVQVDTGGIVVIKRGQLSLRDLYLAPKDVNQFTTCIGAQVFVNGAMMPQPFDINTIALSSIRGIEIYIGPATTPVALRSGKTVCGTVAVWMK
jgi:hypothetical protein